MAFHDDIRKALKCSVGVYNEHGKLLSGDDIGFKATDSILFDGTATYIKVKDAVIAVNSQLSHDACNILKYTYKYNVKEEAADFLQPLEYILKNDVSEESILDKYQGYRVLYIRSKEDVAELIRNIYEGQNFEIVKDEEGLYIVKEVDDIEQEADSLISGICQENGINIIIGSGRQVNGRYTIKDSANHSKDAVSIAIDMGFKEGYFDIDKVSIYGIMRSTDTKKIEYYLKGISSAFSSIAEDKELLETAEELLKCDLNISEASRRLYLHRNTLLYRIEKIKNYIGLDIKKFDEAMVFKTIMTFYKFKKL